MTWSSFARCMFCFVSLTFAGLFGHSPAAFSQERATYCKDPASADLTLRCLSLIDIRNPQNRSCAELRDIYEDGIRKLGTLPSLPTCEMFADAIQKLSGSRPSWAACIGSNVGTKEHVASCLSATPGAVSMSCDAIRASYGTALRQTGISLRQPLRCDIAASAIKIMNGGTPAAWEPCLFYEPGGRHGQQCLQGKTAQFANCGEAIDLYSELLRAAYAGSLPNNYRAANCDEFGPLIEQAAARKQSTSVVIGSNSVSKPTTTTVPLQDNRWQTYVITFFLFCGAALVAVGLYWRRANTKTLTRTATPTTDEAQIREMARAKQGDFAYEGHAVGNLTVNTGGPDGEAIQTLTFSFRIVRNLAAMSHREREFTRIFLLMRRKGWIGSDADNRIQFGLAWGDGRAAVENYEFNIPFHVISQHGISTIGDAIKWYARQMGVNVESAISELLTILGQVQAQFPDDPLVTEITASIASGSRWFTQSDIPGSEFEVSLTKPGLFLGTYKDTNKVCVYQGERSLITLAPPGAGKTQCHIIPNLLIWPGPAIVLDIKGELWAKTSANRQKKGPIYRFAPLDPGKSHRYNPLASVRAAPTFLWEDSLALAELLVVPQGSKDPFWEQTAQRTLAGFIAYVCRKSLSPEARSMADILDLASNVGLREYLDEATSAADMRQLVREATSLQNMESNVRNNVLSQLLTSLRAWSGGRIERTTSDSDWSVGDLRDKNATVYICVRPDEIESALSVLRVIIGQHIRMLSSVLPDHGTAKDVLFFLDEFPQLRRMNPVIEGLSVGRSYGVRLWLIAQSLGQIRANYETQADGMVGMCGIRAFMNPPLHDGTAKKISDDIGYFDSVIDGRRQLIAEPQALAGPEFAEDIIVFGHGAKPIRLNKLYAQLDEPEGSNPFTPLIGEAAWPPNA